MTITMSYSRASAPSARAIAEASGGKIVLVEDSRADINWGRAGAFRPERLNNNTSGTTNKRVMRELFAEHDVPAPQLFTPAEARALFEADPANLSGVALVGRPDTHTRGLAFWLCRSVADVDRALRGTRRKAAATHFMRFVPLGHEFRVHVFNGKSIRISEKHYLTEPDTPMWKRDYETRKPPEDFPRRHLRQAAKQAVAALGLDFGAVDILADHEQAYVLEVNTAPGLGGSMPRVWAQTFINHFEEA